MFLRILREGESVSVFVGKIASTVAWWRRLAPVRHEAVLCGLGRSIPVRCAIVVVLGGQGVLWCYLMRCMTCVCGSLRRVVLAGCYLPFFDVHPAGGRGVGAQFDLVRVCFEDDLEVLGPGYWEQLVCGELDRDDVTGQDDPAEGKLWLAIGVVCGENM